MKYYKNTTKKKIEKWKVNPYLKSFHVHNLSSGIEDKIDNEREFKRLIGNFLYCNNFYSLEEYFNYVEKK
jgi:hypothetical protein